MQMPINDCSDLTFYTHEIRKTIMQETVELLKIDISYPQINLSSNLQSQNLFNIYYQKMGNDFYDFASTDLKNQAIDDYEYAMANDYPFRIYDATMKFYITLQINCVVSTYTDKYTYAGGAHGSTVRTSTNWDLATGEILKMSDLFPEDVDYTTFVITQILEIADQQMQEEPYLYFEDYQELIVKNFNPECFYLTDEGIVVYYQQYEIGPYVSGIIEFLIPYSYM